MRKHKHDIYDFRHDGADSLTKSDRINGLEVGMIGSIPDEIMSIINTVIKATIASTLPDGHCLRRSIAKNHNVDPGWVIKKLKRKCTSMIASNATMKIENNISWYNKIKNIPDRWTNIKSNQPHHCPRSDWGGVNEIQMWAMIAGTQVIVIDKQMSNCTIYLPKGDTIPRRYSLDIITQQHCNWKRNGKPPQYLLYNGVDHYNGIVYKKSTEHTPTRRNNHNSDGIQEYPLCSQLANTATATDETQVKRKDPPVIPTPPQIGENKSVALIEETTNTQPLKKPKIATKLEAAAITTEANMDTADAIGKLRNLKRKQEQQQEQQREKETRDKKEKQTQKKWKQTKISIYTAGKQDNKRKRNIRKSIVEHEQRGKNKRKATE